MTDPTFVMAAVTTFASAVSVGAATVAAIGIWRGIGAMVSANRDRVAQAADDERHHAEAMAPPSTN